MKFVNWLFNRNGHHDSPKFIWLLSLVTLVVVLGWIMVLSSSSIDSLTSTNNIFNAAGRQLLFVVGGFFAMFFLARTSVATIARLTQAFFVLTLLLQGLVFTPLGVDVKGNRNWIGVGQFTIQPSEFYKLAMILICAKFISERIKSLNDPKQFTIPIGIIGGIGIVLVLFGSDLGTAIIIGMVLLAMLLLSGAPMYSMRLPFLLLGAGVALYVFIGSSRFGRISAWLNPQGDSGSPYSWQSEHGIWALAAGRFNGVGLGGSKLKWTWIPEVETDYIFAIIGEEWGWIGAVLFLVFFLLIINFMRQIAIDCDTIFKRMAVTGIMAWFTIQSFVNIAVVLTMLPVLGVPLPLVSYGGSSLLSSMMAIGIVLAIDRDNHSVVVTPLRNPIRTVRR